MAIVTACKRSLGLGNIFAPVSHSVHGERGGIPARIAGSLQAHIRGSTGPHPGGGGQTPPLPVDGYWNAFLFILLIFERQPSSTFSHIY